MVCRTTTCSLSFQIPIILLALIPMNIFLILTTIKSNFPAHIFITRDNYKIKEIFWEIFWGLCLLINLFIFVGTILDRDHITIPINLFFTYLLLTLRAGQINGKANKENASRQQPVCCNAGATE